MKAFKDLSMKERDIFLILLEKSKMYAKYRKKNKLKNNRDTMDKFVIDYIQGNGFYIDTKRTFDLVNWYDKHYHYRDILDGHHYKVVMEERDERSES